MRVLFFGFGPIPATMGFQPSELTGFHWGLKKMDFVELIKERRTAGL
jgi:hypothetical protein